MSAVTGISSHLLRSGFHCEQLPHEAESEEETEEDEVREHTQHGWQEGEVEQHVSDEGGEKWYYIMKSYKIIEWHQDSQWILA